MQSVYDAVRAREIKCLRGGVGGRLSLSDLLIDLYCLASSDILVW